MDIGNSLKKSYAIFDQYNLGEDWRKFKDNVKYEELDMQDNYGFRMIVSVANQEFLIQEARYNPRMSEAAWDVSKLKVYHQHDVDLETECPFCHETLSPEENDEWTLCSHFNQDNFPQWIFFAGVLNPMFSRDLEFYTEKNADYFETLLKKIGRNDPCSCGSGKKYKKCCLV